MARGHLAVCFPVLTSGDRSASPSLPFIVLFCSALLTPLPFFFVANSGKDPSSVEWSYWVVSFSPTPLALWNLCLSYAAQGRPMASGHLQFLEPAVIWSEASASQLLEASP